MAEAEKSHLSPWVWVAGAGILIAICAAWLLLPVNDWIQAFNQWIEGLGVWGFVVFGLVYVLATIALAPGSPLSIAAGLAFGAWGIPFVLVAATIGASLAFLVARYLVRDRVHGIVEERPKFKAVDAAVSDEGWKIVALLRLSPVVPFNLQNYLFGVTNVNFLHYVAATFVGIIPGTLLYVYLGVIGKAAGGGESGGTLKWVFFGVGLIATIVVTVLITRKAKAKLKESGLDGEKS